MGVNHDLPTQGLWHFAVETGLHRAPYSECQGAECQGSYALAVAVRPHSGHREGGWPAVAMALGAILTLRPGAVAGPGPARATARLPGSHWEGWWGMQRQWRALPAAAPNCLQSQSPAKAPPRAATCSQPHSAHSRCVWPAALVITCAQAHYVARRSAPNLRHFSAGFRT